MIRLRKTFATLSALALPLAATAWGQVQAPAPGQPGSDRAGKAARVDTPPADPTPAPGTVVGRQSPTPGTVTRPVNPVSPDVDPSINVTNPAATTRGGGAPAGTGAFPPVVASRQIDRFDAIKKLQSSLKTNPRALADWIILGELAHEVAVDMPAEQAGPYFTMARDAWEKALALEPANVGLRAAVQFAKDQQSHMDEFEKSRDQVTDTFLDARRRDLAATGNTPSVRVDGPPLPDRTMPGNPVAAPGGDTNSTVNAAVTTAAPTNLRTVGRATVGATDAPASTNTGSVGNRVPATTGPEVYTPAGTTGGSSATYGGPPLDYSAAAANRVVYGPNYRPFATPNGQPYTYQQYASSYFPEGLYNNPGAPPMSLQRYSPGVSASRVVPNALERQILNRATTPR